MRPTPVAAASRDARAELPPPRSDLAKLYPTGLIGALGSFFARRMGLAEAAGFCRRMGIGFRAGVDMVRLCDMEAGERASAGMARISRGGLALGGARLERAMAPVAERVRDGAPLAEAMEEAGGGFFPRLLVAMIRAGEESGRLERTLLQLADHYDHQLTTRRIFLMSIAWPLLQVIAAVIALGVLIWIQGVLAPGGRPAFDAVGFGLWGTSGLMIYIALVTSGIVLLWLAIRAVRSNWLGLHRLIPRLYQIPKLGPALQTITLSRFAWTLATTLDAGLDPMRSLRLALDSTDSDYYRARGPAMTQAIAQGGSLSDALTAGGVFPRDFVIAVDVSEVSGTESESIDALARQYEEQAKISIRVIAGIATAVIWISIAGLFVFMILRNALRLFGTLYDVTQF